LVSVNGGKRFLRKCNNAQELACVLTEAAKPRDVKVLIEDYKHIDEEYAILGFSDGKEVIVPGVVKIDKMSLSHPGIGTEGVILPVRGFEELIDKFKEFVRTIGFMGLFDIDFYRSEDTYYFGEMNLRFGGSGYSVTKMGVNLPAMMVRFLTGQPYEGMPHDITEVGRFINERICLDDWYQGFISTKEYRRMTLGPQISFIRDMDDPAPSKAYDSEFRSKLVKRFVKKLINK
jgi:biotin carboxylase